MSTKAGGTAATHAELAEELTRLRLQLASAEAELDRHQRLTDVLLETIPVGIVFCDADAGAWVRNRAVREMLGLEATAKKGVSPEAASAKIDVHDVAGQRVPVTEYPIMRALRGEDVGMVELMVGPAGGPHREVVSHNAQIVGSDGVVLGAVSTLTDVSVERINLRELEEQHQGLLDAQVEAQNAESRFRTLFDQAGIGAVIIGLDGLPTQVNEAVCGLLGRPPELLVGRLWTQYLAPGQVPTGQLIESYLTAGRDTFVDERRYVRPDGSIVCVSAHLTLVRDEQGEPDYLLAQLADITERKQMELDLDHQALHDTPTDLPNRSLFAERVRQALLEAASESVAVVVMLVAGLHTVISKDGYAAGDVVLKEIAQRLIETLDGDVTIGHLEPGQFAVLVKGSTHDSVRAAEQALATVGSPVQLPTGRVSLRAKIGICAAPAGSKAPEALVGRLIQDATSAARRPMPDGSDGIAFASREMRQEQEDQHRTELLLREALDNHTVQVAYQPVVDLATGTVVAAEALLRISDDEGRPIPPQELIPVAEESGLIVEIGIRVLQLATEQAAEWLVEHGVLLPVAVNVSAVQLERAGFQDEVLMAAKRAGLPPEALSIELTESVLLESGSVSIEKLRELRDAGIQLAIDDFGTGYASLSYLRDLPASTLKIDRSFVEGIPHDRGAVAIVAGIIGLARNFGMTCIAEGIETEAQLAYLTERGVQGQGYLLGRPAKGSAISGILAAARRQGSEGPDRSRAQTPGREAAADRRDDVADRRDRVGDERDQAGLLRDEASDLRDARADLRDDAAARRDLAADTRDQAGTVRDEAAQIRDDEAELVDSDSTPSTGAEPVSASSLARRGAAQDRRLASEARRDRATERTSAGIDRAAASTDRDTAASQLVQVGLDRNIAQVDRGSVADARVQAELDRNIAQADRGAGASKSGNAAATDKDPEPPDEDPPSGADLD